MSSSSTSSTSEQPTAYMTKTVKVGGKNITLYSINGMTWLSRPEDLPSTMERLENSRITLNDPKGEGSASSPLQKPTRENFRPRGVRGAPPTKTDGESDVVDGEEMRADEVDDGDDDLDRDDSAQKLRDDDSDDEDEVPVRVAAVPKKADPPPAPKSKAAPVKVAAPVAKMTKTQPKATAKPKKAAPGKKVAKAAPAKAAKKPTPAKKAVAKKKR